MILTADLFCLKVDWVPVSFSKKGLHFWEGAATWSFQDIPIGIKNCNFKLRESSCGCDIVVKSILANRDLTTTSQPQGFDALKIAVFNPDRYRTPYIQLHPRFKKGRFWIYSLEEVLAHEAVHAARSYFDEPEFEEILAYQTARTKFRKFFGPLFRAPHEALICMGSFFIPILGQFFDLEILWTLPCLILGYFMMRLVRSQMIFERCKKKVGLPALLYLTDEEIRSFSKLSKEKIFSYLKNSQLLRHKGSIACAMKRGEV